MNKTKTLRERVPLLIIFVGMIAFLGFVSKQAEASTAFTVSGTPSAYIPTTSFYVDGSEGLGATYAYTSSTTFTPSGIAFKAGKATGSDASAFEARLIDYTTGTNYDWDFTPADQSFDLYQRTSTPTFISGGSGAKTINAGEPFYMEIVSYGPSSTYFGSVDSTDKGVWFSTAGATGFAPTNSTFYAQISNATSTGYLRLYDATSTSGNTLETLPNDWIVQVASTTDSGGNPITAGGYQWYQVTNPTDGVTGWMKAGDSSGVFAYLPYDSTRQSALEASSSEFITSSTTRASYIAGAVDYYYNNTGTSSSLYSSDDISGYHISRLKTEGDGYPETLVLGIIARESGDIIDGGGFDNENITSDFGHGIMQITFNPFGEHQFDNRGVVSKVTLPQCAGEGSSLYENCYTSADGTSPYYRHYMADTSISGSPTFRQYSNTLQSMYANIKDGMGILSDWYDSYDYITTSATVDSVTYSADERKDILATDSFNAGNFLADGCGYVGNVANKLDEINKYFSNATSSAITDIVEKMHDADSDSVCANLDSPGDLSIQNSQGEVVGVVNGQGINTFPLANYSADKKYVHVFAAKASDDYKYVVTGTADATYGLDVIIKEGTQKAEFHAKDIPTKVGEIHTYKINKAALLSGKGNAVTIDIQAANGIDKGIITAGAAITGNEFSSALPTFVQALSSNVEDASSTADSSSLSTSTNAQ